MTWAERCYRALLLCYPAEFRHEYAAEMTQVFRDRLRDDSSALVWPETIADVALTASREHTHMLIADLRYTLRALRQSPAFASAAIVTLALGIGANTAIFSVVNAVMLRPMPYVQPDRLVRIAEKNDKLGFTTFSSSVPNYLDWREQSTSFEAMGSIGGAAYNLTGAGEPERLDGGTISPSIFPLLGLRPIVGRSFVEGEDRPSAARVVMLAEGLWRRRFGGDPKVVGSTITLNGAPYTVIGVAPAALAAQGGDVFTPLVVDLAQDNRLNHQIATIGRLKPGVSIHQAQAEMDTVFARLAREHPEIKDWGIRLQSLYDWFVRAEVRTGVLVLLGAVSLVLLIACANVANLLLSRAAARQKEIAVRVALGASRARLVRQLLTESVALSMVGGGAGLLAAWWGIHAMSTAVNQTILPTGELSLDTTVLWFAVAVSVMTGLLFGVAPAWHAAQSDLNTTLKSAARGSTGGARPLLRKALVAGELGLATVLLIGAGLLTQSLLRLQRVPLGFNPDRLLTFHVSLPRARYATADQMWAFYRKMLESLDAIPGVTASAASTGIPFGGGNYSTSPITTPGNPTAIPVEWRIVSPAYFRTMEIPLLRGRLFTDDDSNASPPPAILSQEAVDRLWHGEDPIGRTISFTSGKRFTVIGVAAGSRIASLNQPLSPAMYLSATWGRPAGMDIVARTAGRPEALVGAVRQKVRELDSELPLANVRTMEQWLDQTSTTPRLNALLVAIFSAVALLIAAIGIYGVLSYSVTQRTREIGLRIAIGAKPTAVLRWIVGEGMTVALAGIAAGLAGAFALSRMLETLLFDIAPRDPRTFGAVAAILGAVAAIACYLPARRASRVDPIVALRED